MTEVERMIDVRREEWQPRTPEIQAAYERSLRTPESRTSVEAHHGGGPLNGRDVVDYWRAIINYHINGRGWQDIWYNLGIHPDGRVFELRGPYNANSSRPFLTVNFPGNSDHDLTDAQVEVFQGLRLAHFNDTGHDTLAWHAERGGTACPGNTLIHRLKEIREAEAAAGGIVVASSVPADDPSLPNAVGPLVGPVTTPSVRGYYVVGADGGVFTFGDVPFHGSLPGKVPSHDSHVDPIVGMALHEEFVSGILTITGYYLMSRAGAIFAFGAAPWNGRVEVF